MNLDSIVMLPCQREDFLRISEKGSFCYPPFDPTQDDDPVSLDSFFCNVAPCEEEDHFFRTYKFVENGREDDIFALASVANSSITFDTYEDTPDSLQNSGYNEAFPAVMLSAFGVRFDLQKKGIGKRAFELLLEGIRKHSFAGVRLLTLHPLPEAVRFYLGRDCKPFYDEEGLEVESMVLDIWKKESKEL